MATGLNSSFACAQSSLPFLLEAFGSGISQVVGDSSGNERRARSMLLTAILLYELQPLVIPTNL